MMRRCLVLPLLLALAGPVPAVAQQSGGNPFGPLPQDPTPAPPQAPTPKKISNNTGPDDGLGTGAFWLIVGATGALFVAVGFIITRDMRRSVGKRKKPRRLRGSGRPAADAAEELARHTPGSHKAKAKAQQRSKTKAARKQRRKSRSR
jgi:hypothetical protein